MKITLDKYKQLIKNERNDFFLSPFDFIYQIFEDLEFVTKNKIFFRKNASLIVEQLRELSWKKYLPLENEFTSNMLKLLINKDKFEKLNSIDSITSFCQEFVEHIYALFLSNTQSRRSRAGKEFETIIQLILTGAGIAADNQGSVGKDEFAKRGLAKLVDFVSPSVVEYVINKRNTLLISAKTTLRERWQEVPEEMNRTGAQEIFLITLDENISKEVLFNLYESNVHVVTTKKIKELKYSDNPRILSLEELIEICLDNSKKWNGFKHSEIEKEFVLNSLELKLEKYKDYKFIHKFYEEAKKNI